MQRILRPDSPSKFDSLEQRPRWCDPWVLYGATVWAAITVPFALAAMMLVAGLAGHAFPKEAWLLPTGVGGGLTFLARTVRPKAEVGVRNEKA